MIEPETLQKRPAAPPETRPSRLTLTPDPSSRRHSLSAACVDPVTTYLPPTPQPHCSPQPAAWEPLQLGRYQITLAKTVAEREAACRLRFKVFNIELGEGLQASYQTGLDTDHFDLFCDHLIVEDRSTHAIVGTYRMQSGVAAGRNLGYYSEQEFDFAPYEPLRGQVLELGRASIDREHRSSEVLTLLWRGIAQYSRQYDLRYMIGCSSVNSQSPEIGWQLYRQFAQSMVSPGLQTHPTAAYTLPAADEASEQPAKVPKLLRTYIGMGAKICSAPALDREFGTIDFLTLLDMRELTPAARVRFLTEAK